MTSRRTLTFLAIAVTAAPRALSRRHATLPSSPSLAGNFSVNSCDNFRVQFADHEGVVQSEDRTFTKTEAPRLHIQAESNGGLYVQGWDQDTYSVTLCKAAEAGVNAQSILSQLHLSFQDGVVRVSAPSFTEHWATHLLIRTPRASVLDLQVHNGPMTLSHVNGDLKVRAENGPVTVIGCTGRLDLSSQNGPVTLEDNGGKQSVQSENGPISLSLSGTAWKGTGLEARTTNGPVTLEVPSGYQSGVLLESAGLSPFEYSAKVCSEGRKTWDDDHKRVEFGAGLTLVRISTVHGPVSVRE
jgi:hypothetical protein